MIKGDCAGAISGLKSGGIIAYPTEAVYGIGCDPYNKDSVKLELDKSFINHFDNIDDGTEYGLVLTLNGLTIDYIEITDIKNLSAVKIINQNVLISLAVYFKNVRLIDNIEVVV